MQHPSLDFHTHLHSADLVEAELRRRLSGLGIHPRQARVIDAIDRLGSATQNDIAREFDLTPASVSTMTARLIAAGWISRAANPAELRSNVLGLSPEGQALLVEIRRIWQAVDGLIEAAIGTRDARLLTRLNRKLRNALGGHAPSYVREAPAGDAAGPGGSTAGDIRGKPAAQNRDAAPDGRRPGQPCPAHSTGTDPDHTPPTPAGQTPRRLRTKRED